MAVDGTVHFTDMEWGRVPSRDDLRARDTAQRRTLSPGPGCW